MKVCLILLLSLFFISCNYDLQYYRDIVGIWQCVNMENENQSENCENDQFRFLEDRSFHIKQGELFAEGYYKIDGNKIHYSEVGASVNSFRIKSISEDSMIWETLDSKTTAIIRFVRKNEI